MQTISQIMISSLFIEFIVFRMKPLILLGIFNFIRTVCIILLVYYGVKLLFQVLSPYLMKWVQRKAMEKMGGFQQGNPRPEEKQKEGDVTIDKKKSTNKKGSIKDKGEYVDFEEVD